MFLFPGISFQLKDSKRKIVIEAQEDNERVLDL